MVNAKQAAQIAQDAKRPIEHLVMRQREYIERIQPYVEYKARIYNTALPTIIVWSDGSVKYEHNFNETQKISLRLIDEAIEQIRKSFEGA